MMPLTSKTLWLVGFLILGFLDGALGQYFYPDSTFSPIFVGCVVAGTLTLFMWFRSDTNERSYRRPPLLTVAVIAFAALALPCYFFSSRGFKGGLVMTGLFVLLVGAYFALQYAGATAVYFVSGSSFVAADGQRVNHRYLSLRNKMFNLSPADLNLLFPGAKPEVWGAAVEEATGFPFYVAVTVFTLANTEKHTSVYTSSGGGFLGLGSNATVAELSRLLLTEAEHHYRDMSTTVSFPLPAPGHVTIYVFTSSGVYMADVAAGEISREDHPLNKLHRAYWDIRFETQRTYSSP
jgi:hypothetical protein